MKNQLLLISLIFTFGIAQSQTQGRLQKIIDQIGSSYSNHPSEKVFIQTDKDFYQPGETIWFSSFTIDVNTQNLATDQTEILFNLIDPAGKKILSDKYVLEKGQAFGDFLLADDLKDGDYYISALLPGQSNINDISIQKIVVRSYYPNSLIISITQKEKVLQKGFVNEISVSVNDINGNAVKNQKLEYTVTQGTLAVSAGRLKTDDSGNSVILFQLPENSDGTPFRLNVTDSKNIWDESVQLVSETDQVNISFYPEGSTIIPEKDCRIGFYATDVLGNPVDIVGQLKNSDNQNTMHIETLYKGFGICTVSAEKNSKYSFHITKGIGKGQQFDLPNVNSTGSSLSVLKTETDSVLVNLTFADHLSHPVMLIASQGGKVFWATEATVNETENLKIPTAKLPKGLVLLSSYSDEGFPLNQRLINVSEITGFKIEVIPDQETIRKGNQLNLQIRTSDRNGNPVSGVVRVAVSDNAWIAPNKPNLSSEITYNSVLKNKLIIDKNFYKGNFDKQQTFDCFLLANELQNLDIKRITAKQTDNSREKTQLINLEKIENALGEKVRVLNQNRLSSEKQLIPKQYFALNPELISKKPKRSVNEIPKNDSYKKFLETSTNLLEVIKIIKPFNLEGNKIIFPGGHNSFNAQGGALIVIDGQQMGEDASTLNGISTHDVEEINVSTSPIDIQRYTGLNSVGLIEITTKRGKYTESKEKPDEKETLYCGDYRIPREFSIPDKKGLNTTALWKSELQIDSSGQTVLNVPVINVVTDYIITIEGFGTNGQFGYCQKQIKVTE